MILVTTNLGPENACGDTAVNFLNLDSVADAAIAVYDEHGLPPIPLSVANVPGSNHISIFPNPAHDRLYIESSAPVTGKESITVYNTLGQAVNVPQSHNGQKTELDLTLLPAGLYNILYRDGNTQVTEKFIRE